MAVCIGSDHGKRGLWALDSFFGMGKQSVCFVRLVDKISIVVEEER